jgi:hypothetical protein
MQAASERAGSYTEKSLASMLLGMQSVQSNLKQARTQAAHKHARASLLAMEDPYAGCPPHLRDALERKRAKAAGGAPAPAPAPPAYAAPAPASSSSGAITQENFLGRNPYPTPEEEARTAKYVRWINSNKHGYDCSDGVNYVNTGVPPKQGPERDMEAQYLAWINSNKHGYDCTDGMKKIWNAGGGIPPGNDDRYKIWWKVKHDESR